MKPGDIFTLRVPYMAHRRIEAGKKRVQEEMPLFAQETPTGKDLV